jgi:hypothetical protein
MMIWLLNQPKFQQARDLEVSTRNFNDYNDDSNVMIEGESDGGDGSKRKLAYLPSYGVSWSWVPNLGWL